ncbi:hypothetical protein SDJN03_23959, partial [Cucurbita argyrosperma subsp. sororia]
MHFNPCAFVFNSPSDDANVDGDLVETGMENVNMLGSAVFTVLVRAMGPSLFPSFAYCGFKQTQGNQQD